MWFCHTVTPRSVRAGAKKSRQVRNLKECCSGDTQPRRNASCPASRTARIAASAGASVSYPIRIITAYRRPGEGGTQYQPPLEYEGGNVTSNQSAGLSQRRPFGVYLDPTRRRRSTRAMTVSPLIHGHPQ